jgi:transposase InsO family protein
MPWKESSRMSSRLEFVQLALAPDANMQALCQSFGVSRKTGYKWRDQYLKLGQAGLEDRSRRPHSSPNRSTDTLETAVLALHEKYPCWGARKLKALLDASVGNPHPNTIAAILRRHGKELAPHVDVTSPATKRFEHEAPNHLWQMDFKGHIAMTDEKAGRCHPLTVLDDHSRFALCLTACTGEDGAQVQAALTQTFRTYGLPERITCDNGAPWGTAGHGTLSRLEVWLMRLGIRVSHSRPHHPQTQGKDERFHRTLKRELLNRYGYSSISSWQCAFNDWRDQYNLIRPHEALGQQTPVTRYQPSARRFPSELPPVEYDEGDIVRIVQRHGQISFKGEIYFVGEGLYTQEVAIRPTSADGIFSIVFCDREVSQINLAGR